MTQKLADATGIVNFYTIDFDLLPTHVDIEDAKEMQRCLEIAYAAIIRVRQLSVGCGFDLDQHVIDQINTYVLDQE